MKNDETNTVLDLRRLVFVFFSFQAEFGICEQKNQSILSSVRTVEHGKFTRIVFEFQNAVQFKDPMIIDKEKFSVLFLDCSTDLPLFTVYWVNPFQKVQSVKFIKNKSNLTAEVKLTFPHFLLKAFSLSNPDRVVVDAYKSFASSKEIVQNTSLNDGTSLEFEKTKLNLDQERILPSRYTVYLHYSNEKNKNLMEELAFFLKNLEFDVKGIERFNYNNRDIRYFHGKDKLGAILLKKYLTQFINSYTNFKDTNIKILNLSRKYPNAKKGALEAWGIF